MNRGDKIIVEEVAAQAADLGYSRLDDMFLLAQEVYKHELDWDDWQQAFAEALIRECRRLIPRRATWQRFAPWTRRRR